MIGLNKSINIFFKKINYKIKKNKNNYLYNYRLKSIKFIKNNKKIFLKKIKKYNINIENFFKKNKKEKNNKKINEYILKKKKKIKIVLINGKYYYKYSKIEKFFFIDTLSNAFNNIKHKKYIKKILNKKNINNYIDRENYIENYLNTLFMKDGIYIYIKKNIKYKIPIYIYNIYNEKNIFHFPRILIIIDKNSSVSIIEKYKNFKKKSLIFNVNDIYIKENSNLNYLKIQNEKKNNFIIDNTFFFQKKKTKCYINTFSLNNFFTKNYLYILQEGEKSKSILNGLFFGYNKQYIKNYTKINHNFPNCKSYELYKGIFKDKSKYYFNGEIFINKKSNKIDAFQKNNYILLSDKSKVKAIPKLNIYNDEVKCSHGCTLSNINESNLFYLQTRGLSKKKAKLIIIYSFIEENLFFLKKISFINFLKKKIKKIIEKFLL